MNSTISESPPEEEQGALMLPQTTPTNTQNQPKKQASILHLSESLPDVKDKGYAWLIIFVMFLSNVTTAGYIKSFGILYNQVAINYPNTSAAAGGTMMALLAGCRSLLAPAIGAATVQFGYRPVMVFGVFLCSGGLLLSFACTSVATLAVTLGAMMGTGMCCIETVQVVVLSDYFSEKKELANALKACGNPLGGAILPYILVQLFENFGLKLSYIILAGIYFQLLVCVALIRPYKTHQLIVRNNRIHKLKGKNKSPATMSIEIEKVETPQPTEEKAKKFDLKLFLNPLYITLVSMIVFLSINLPQVQYFLPIFGKTINLSPRQNSIILGHQAIFDSVCRFLLGFMLNKKLFKKTHCLMGCLLIGGIGTCCIPFSNCFWTTLTTTTIFSIGSSGYFVTLNVILIDQFGKNNVASSYGFIKMTQGLLNFVYPPILGLMADKTGEFYWTFICMGAGMLMASFSVALQPLVVKVAKLDVKLL